MYIDAKMRGENNNITYFISLPNYKSKAYIRKNTKVRMKAHIFIKCTKIKYNQLAKEAGITYLYLRKFLDGKDISIDTLSKLENVMKHYGRGNNEENTGIA